MDARFHVALAHNGLLPFSLLMDGANIGAGRRSPLPALDAPLLTALTDRWRPETHTFHLPCGEMTITLQNVAMITGLPISGEPFVVPKPARVEWEHYLENR